MKNILLLIFCILLSQNINAQEKYALGFSFGIGQNYFNNKFETDGNHFKFDNPASILIGAQLIKYINAKNQIVAQLNYTSKRVKFEYNSNEPNIPFNENAIIIDKFDCFAIAFGYRRSIQISNVITFIEIDLVTSYNVNFAQGSVGSGSTDDSATITEPILYQRTIINNLGQESITIGSNFTFGFNFGKKKSSELSFNLDIPFSNIQSKTSNFQYIWQYQGLEYTHNLNYIGRIIFPSLKFTYYVFKK